jgi:hypothetical protein
MHVAQGAADGVAAGPAESASDGMLLGGGQKCKTSWKGFKVKLNVHNSKL